MGAMVTLRDMAYVIVQPCVGVKDASCVEVFPVDCIHTDDAATMYYIDPDECIECTLCVPECPVDAIFAEDDVPPAQRAFTPLNAELAKIWKPIIAMKPALPDADEWAQVKDKLDRLVR